MALERWSQSSEPNTIKTLCLNKGNVDSHIIGSESDSRMSAHFPTDAAVLKNQPVTLREMRKHTGDF